MCKTLDVPERPLQPGWEERHAVHAEAARGGDHGGQESQEQQDHQLDQTGQHLSPPQRITLLILLRKIVILEL